MDHIIITIRVRNIRILVIFYMRMVRFVANFNCIFDQNFPPNLHIYAIHKLILTPGGAFCGNVTVKLVVSK
jgi:hypothetical protein